MPQGENHPTEPAEDEPMAKSDADAQRILEKARARVASQPVLDAAVREIERESAKYFERKNLERTLEAISTRKLTLDQLWLDLARRADAVVGKALRAHERVAGDESRLDAQVREALQARAAAKEDEKDKSQRSARKPAPRTRPKDAYVVRGKLLDPTSHEPVGGVVVDVVDRDVFRHDALGAAVTAADGSFEITFPATRFREGGEGDPEIELRAGASRQSLSRVEDADVKVKGREILVVAKLPPAAVAAVAALESAVEDVDAQRLEQLRHAGLASQLQGEALARIGGVVRAGLGQIIDRLQDELGVDAAPAPAEPASRRAVPAPSPKPEAAHEPKPKREAAAKPKPKPKPKSKSKSTKSTKSKSASIPTQRKTDSKKQTASRSKKRGG